MRLIDADALRDEIAVLFERNPKLIDGWLAYAVEDTIDDAPTIDTVKHGRWSREHLPSTSGGTYEVWRCSECQSAFNWRMRHCGHCGARMDEVTE